MIDLFQVASEVEQFCRAQSWRFCFIGGVALQRWGQPRVTQDVDLTIITGFGNEEVFVRTLLGCFAPRIDDAMKFALENRVLLLKSETGIGIDVALGAIEFEERVVRRSSPFEFLPEVSLSTCSAEDLIVLKAFADRPRDWGDVEGIVIRQSRGLDWDYVEQQLLSLVLLKEAPEIMDKLRAIKRSA